MFREIFKQTKDASKRRMHLHLLSFSLEFDSYLLHTSIIIFRIKRQCSMFVSRMLFGLGQVLKLRKLFIFGLLQAYHCRILKITSSDG
jgi:hypothetical protein